MKMK
jgi:hypothetical protein